MAKISAYNSHKVAERSFDVRNGMESTGNVSRYFFVLRSDGAILLSSSFPFHPAGSYDRKRGGYSIAARIRNTVPASERVAVFERYVMRRSGASDRLAAL